MLIASGLISVLAGRFEEVGLDPFLKYPALLVLVPPLLSLSGSLAGILAARLATKLHLGLLDASRFSLRPILDDIGLVYGFSVSIFAILGFATLGVAHLAGLARPSVFVVVATALGAGLLATTFTNVVAYFGAFLTYRFSLDPDNFGIPLTAAVSDLLGAISLVVALFALGLT